MAFQQGTHLEVKSFFLGPQAENGSWLRGQIESILEHWFQWRKGCFPEDGKLIFPSEQVESDFVKKRAKFESLLQTLNERWCSETPKFTPRYIGHMVSEVSMPALLGAFLTLIHNPNNVCREVARVGKKIEEEAIGELLKMFGWDEHIGTGHFTSCGTIANMEALWRARYRLDHWISAAFYQVLKKGKKDLSFFNWAHQGWDTFYAWLEREQIAEDVLKPYSMVLEGAGRIAQKLQEKGISFPQPVILVPAHRHYSWPKGVSLLGFGMEAFCEVKLDACGNLDIEDLKSQIERARALDRPIGMVVSCVGTTELGGVDPVDQVAALLKRYRKEGLFIWHHVDAAYGGFFASLLHKKEGKSFLKKRVEQALGAVRQADSVTVDPHKLGYVPYACGSILVPSIENNRVSSFPAPYLDPQDDGKWTSTLEGSRGALGATATWLTAHAMGLHAQGFGKVLNLTLQATSALRERLSVFSETRFLGSSDTNIVCFALARKGEKLSQINERTQAFYHFLEKRNHFTVSRTWLSLKPYQSLIVDFLNQVVGEADEEVLFTIRMVVMNPFLLSHQRAFRYLDGFQEELKVFLEEKMHQTHKKEERYA